MVDKKREVLEPPLAFLRELWALDHALASTSKRMHDRIGITAQQRMVLRFVGKLPGITAIELAEILHLERGSLSQALKLLEKRGLVSRRVDTVDRRRTFIELTKAGRKFDVPAVGTVERAVARTLDESSAADVARVRDLLRRLTDRLSDTT